MILLICVFIAFLSRVEFKLYAGKDLVCLAHHYIPSASVSACHLCRIIQSAKYTDAWASERQAEKRTEDGVRLNFSDFSQSFAIQKTRKENFLFYNAYKVLSFCLDKKNLIM